MPQETPGNRERNEIGHPAQPWRCGSVPERLAGADDRNDGEREPPFSTGAHTESHAGDEEPEKRWTRAKRDQNALRESRCSEASAAGICAETATNRTVATSPMTTPARADGLQ